jgi:hypothetical protein
MIRVGCPISLPPSSLHRASVTAWLTGCCSNPSSALGIREYRLFIEPSDALKVWPEPPRMLR